MWAALGLAMVLAGWQVDASCETLFIDATVRQEGDGTRAFPFRSLAEAVIRSGNSYLFRRGGVYDGGIELGGVEDVQLGAWGEGPPPLIDGKGAADYGIRLLSTSRVTVSDLEFGNFKGACILVVGSRDYQIRNNHCHDALYGVAVNAGKLGPGGLIEGNRIHRVAGDGIGSWNLAAGVVIRGNHIFEFGNDGIDILGSFGAIVEGNTIHDSVDHPELPRGLGHTGVKAGGNGGAGGGGNVITGNTVYRVKNFGIWNRGAVGNVYRGNTCFENGVNFNFVSSEEPSLAVIENNVARDPTFAAGLRYSVFIPAAADLRHAANNRWHGGLINVKGSGLVTDLAEYLQIMQPLEQGTQF